MARVPQDMHEILERYGIRDAEVVPLVAGNHDSLDVRFEREGEDRRATLRLYHDWVDREDVLAEVNWLAALNRDTDLLVPRPIPALDGSLVQTPRPRTGAAHAVLRSWLPGTLLAEAITPGRFGQVGDALARLHDHAASFTGIDSARRQPFVVWVDDWSGARSIADDAEAILAAAAERISAAMGTLSKEPDRFGYIHGDPHPWNLLVDGDHVGIIDFSDCGWGPYAYDIASTLVYCKFPWVWDDDPPAADYASLETALLQGYASVRALPGDLEESLPVCFAARLLVFVQWVLADLGDIDATAYSREAVANAIDYFRRYWSATGPVHR